MCKVLSRNQIDKLWVDDAHPGGSCTAMGMRKIAREMGVGVSVVQRLKFELQQKHSAQ